ncbi:MAG TPA: PEGA domain-containing protein [Proteobacteria bacterium]|nr:PEGA domain-containing protein [Pseudomonadota bacterium]
MRIASILALAAVAVLFVSCMTPQAEVKGQGNEGLIAIFVKPSDALVYVDGQLVGKAHEFDGRPGYLQVPSGRHWIEIKKDGYKPYKREIYASNALIEIRVTLERESD